MKKIISYLIILLLSFSFINSCSEDSSITGYPERLPSEHFYFAMDFVDLQTGWVVGTKGGIFKTTDGGKSWIDQSLEIDDKMVAIHFTNFSYGWAASDKELFSTFDGGTTWKHIPLDFTTGKDVQICLSDTGRGWVAPDSYGLILGTRDSGNTWRKNFYSEHPNVTGISFINYKIGYFCSYSGRIFKTIDGWGFSGSRGIRYSQALCFVTEDIGIVGTNIILSSDSSARAEIYKTTDGAGSWNKQFTFNELAVWEIKFANAYIGVAVAGDLSFTFHSATDYIPTGFPYYTINGGYSWSKINNLPSAARIIAADMPDEKGAYFLNTNGQVMYWKLD